MALREDVISLGGILGEAVILIETPSREKHC